MGDRVLIHVCCAPCATVVVPGFRDEGFEVSAYFYNPNIHPWSEYNRRLETLESWVEAQSLDLEVESGYPLEENLRLLLSSDPRCAACFRDRLGTTAKKAADLGFDAFSTTLVVSPYQDHELLLEIGSAVSSDVGIRFLYRDSRPEYKESIRISRQLGLYRQPYCGCVMSERDRYTGDRTVQHSN